MSFKECMHNGWKRKWKKLKRARLVDEQLGNWYSSELSRNSKQIEFVYFFRVCVCISAMHEESHEQRRKIQFTLEKHRVCCFHLHRKLSLHCPMISMAESVLKVASLLELMSWLSNSWTICIESKLYSIDRNSQISNRIISTLAHSNRIILVPITDLCERFNRITTKQCLAVNSLWNFAILVRCIVEAH